MSIRPSKNPPADPAKTAPESAPTLAQEKSNFTAEGSPPPGQVAGAVPLLPVEDALPLAPAETSKGGEPGRCQPPSPAGPVRRKSKRNAAAPGGEG